MNENAQSMKNSFFEGIKENAGAALGMGLAMMALGALALVAPGLVGVSIMMVMGVILIAGGIGQCILAFKVDAFGRGVSIFIMGLLTLLVGIFMSFQPVEALISITFFLVIYFIVTGIIEGVTAFRLKPAPGWGWMLINACITILLGLMIWRQFPLSGVWALGVLFGIKLFFSGITFISLGTAARREVKAAAASS